MTASKDQVAQIIVGEAQKRGHTRDECLAEMSALYQESGWDETIWDPTHTTYGVAQQDGSYPNRFDGAAAQVKAFFDKLDVKRKSPGHGDIWLNICWLQQAPNWPSAQYWYDNGRRAYLDEIKSRIDTVTPYLDKYWPATGGPPVTAPTNRPDFNEYEDWCDNYEDRGGTKVDLFLLHTQEGGDDPKDAAQGLADFIKSTTGGPNPVSYHYAISEDPVDHGVTVIDLVDTDDASWSVMSSNDRSINLCFAGSLESWTRDEWLSKFGHAIDVAAYLAVQDCQKYDIDMKVIPGPNYNSDPPGISDHRYCSDYLKDGNNHTDVGDNFPWDTFAAAVAKYAGGAPAPGPTPTPAPAAGQATGDQALADILVQLLGPFDKATGTYTGWPQLGQNPDGTNRSLVDGMAALMQAMALFGSSVQIIGHQLSDIQNAVSPPTVTTPPAPAKKAPAKKPATKAAAPKPPAKQSAVKATSKITSKAPAKRPAQKRAR